MCLKRRCRVERAIARRLAGTGKARIRGGNDCVHTQQRRISVAKQGDIGDGERALGLAMVALREADEAALLRLAVVSPVVKAHLQRDFHRGGELELLVVGGAHADEARSRVGPLAAARLVGERPGHVRLLAR